jgi:hypothetical protein
MHTNTRFRAIPFATGVFILAIISGLLFTFNIVIGLSQTIQVWLSALFVITVIFYTVLNRKQFT